ncbi:MAG: signal peptide peptidase SppA [Candidatus Promineifilaceae bacterium]
MISSNDALSLRKRLLKAPGQAWQWFSNVQVVSDAYVRNWLRRLRRASVDYVIMPVSGPLPEREGPRPGFLGRQLPWWPAPPLSMEYLNGRLQLIADADNVKGVLLIFQGIETGLATMQNFRRSLERLREAGKESVIFTPYLDLRHYYTASAADRIYAPPGATFNVLGLHAEVVFLKDALQQLGVEMDVVQISPYKTAFDNLQHATISPEYREQLNWLLDDEYDMITAGIAESRGLEQETLKALIDGAPYSAERAVELGLIDGLAYEDELAYLLAEKAPGKEEAPAVLEDKKETLPEGANEEAGAGDRPQATIKSWPKAYRLLLEKPRRSVRRFVGVVSMEGMMTMGPSRRSPIDLPIPFLGGSTAGEQTIVNLLRRVERIDDLAALVFHVDSGGGVALAADFIGREMERIGRKIPIVVYMGNVAASGGYYVSAPAHHIMCQPGTTTGSIGVITVRPSTRDLYRKLMINRVTLQRGEHANLYSDAAPMTVEERKIYMDEVVRSYDQFKQVVATGRDLPVEDLDPVCEGRVWTGRQALARELVDSHGDFVEAIKKAAELGGLPVDDDHAIAVANLFAKGDGYILPRPYDEVQELGRLLSGERLRELSARPVWLMPYQVTVR